MVGVVQLVEHQIVILAVAGSSPVVHPNTKAGVSADRASTGLCRFATFWTAADIAPSGDQTFAAQSISRSPDHTVCPPRHLAGAWMRLTDADGTAGGTGPENGERARGGLSRRGTAFEEDRARLIRPRGSNTTTTRSEPPLGWGPSRLRRRSRVGLLRVQSD